MVHLLTQRCDKIIRDSNLLCQRNPETFIYEKILEFPFERHGTQKHFVGFGHRLEQNNLLEVLDDNGRRESNNNEEIEKNPWVSPIGKSIYEFTASFLDASHKKIKHRKQLNSQLEFGGIILMEAIKIKMI